MEVEELSRIVKPKLEDFYRRRLQKLNELKLKDTLKKKNPYLFRAIGVQKASEIVERLLSAYMSSSEETIFGDAFFEPLAREVCQGRCSDAYGMDVAVESPETYTILSIKSGPNWGNSSSVAKLEQDFRTAQYRFNQRKVFKQFRAVLGHCYGRRKSEPTARKIYAIRSGQAFWQELTGDPDFFAKLINSMSDLPLIHRTEYEEAWNRAINRFAREFIAEFVTIEGEIDWTKLVYFNSGEG